MIILTTTSYRCYGDTLKKEFYNLIFFRSKLVKSVRTWCSVLESTSIPLSVLILAKAHHFLMCYGLVAMPLVYYNDSYRILNFPPKRRKRRHFEVSVCRLY